MDNANGKEHEDDNLRASLAHVFLCCVAVNGMSRISGKGFIYPGMHTNFFIHGVVGYLHNQSEHFKVDLRRAYTLSYDATRCFGLPCLMADIYRGREHLSILHLASGAMPFALTLIREENAGVVNLMILANIASLLHYSVQNSRQWGYYTAGAAVLAYFIAPRTRVPLFYPMTLAVLEYCAYKIRHVRCVSSAE